MQRCCDSLLLNIAVLCRGYRLIVPLQTRFYSFVLDEVAAFLDQTVTDRHSTRADVTVIMLSPVYFQFVVYSRFFHSCIFHPCRIVPIFPSTPHFQRPHHYSGSHRSPADYKSWNTSVYCYCVSTSTSSCQHLNVSSQRASQSVLLLAWRWALYTYSLFWPGGLGTR